MRKILNLIISNLKGETFRLDDNVPLTYLLNFFIVKFMSLCYGVIRFGGGKFCPSLINHQMYFQNKIW